MWKSIKHSEIFRNPNLLQMWIYLLVEASHVKTTRRIGRTTVNLEPGDLVWSRTQSGQELSKPESTVRNLIEKLKALDAIEDTTEDAIKDTLVDRPNVTVLRIRKWKEYQLEGHRSGHSSGQVSGQIRGHSAPLIKPRARKEGLPSVNPSLQKSLKNDSAQKKQDRSGGWTLGEDGTFS